MSSRSGSTTRLAVTIVPLGLATNPEPLA